MLDFRLNLSRFLRKSLIKSLSEAIESATLILVKRIQAILAVADGHSFSAIASILRVSKESIRQWVIKYLSGGLNALLTVKKRSGRPNKLTWTQKKQLKQWLTHGPQSVGFPGACWRTPMIQELIYQKFGVLYSVKYLSEFLKNLGFSYQKARFAVGGKNPENTLKRKIWIEQTLPEIVARHKNKKHISCLGMKSPFLSGAASLIHGLQLDTNLLFLLREYEKAIKYSDLSTTFPAGSSTKLLRAAQLRIL